MYLCLLQDYVKIALMNKLKSKLLEPLPQFFDSELVFFNHTLAPIIIASN